MTKLVIANIYIYTYEIGSYHGRVVQVQGAVPLTFLVLLGQLEHLIASAINEMGQHQNETGYAAEHNAPGYPHRTIALPTDIG